MNMEKELKWTGGFDEACEVEGIFVKLVDILPIKYTIFKKSCLNKFGGQLLFVIYSISTRIFFLKNHHRFWMISCGKNKTVPRKGTGCLVLSLGTNMALYHLHCFG